jgi:ComF family protein
LVFISAQWWIGARPLKLLVELAGCLADFVFPPYCSGCRRRMPEGQREPMCRECWGRATLWSKGACQRCGAELPAGAFPRLCSGCRIEDWPCADIRTPGPFAGPVAEAIHLLKYSERRSIARRLAGLMADCLEPESGHRRADLIAAVPLHPAKLRERGYNQAQLLADELSPKLGIPADRKAVWRCRHNPTQTKLNKQQRLDNVRGIFRVEQPFRVSGKTVLLIDDVLTTGATIGSCGRALLEAGASQVLALTAAAAPLD